MEEPQEPKCHFCGQEEKHHRGFNYVPDRSEYDHCAICGLPERHHRASNFCENYHGQPRTEWYGKDAR